MFFIFVEFISTFQKPVNVEDIYNDEIPQNTLKFVFCVFVVYLTTLLGHQIT
jgi:hypothetical protein